MEIIAASSGTDLAEMEYNIHKYVLVSMYNPMKIGNVFSLDWNDPLNIYIRSGSFPPPPPPPHHQLTLRSSPLMKIYTSDSVSRRKPNQVSWIISITITVPVQFSLSTHSFSSAGRFLLRHLTSCQGNEDRK